MHGSWDIVATLVRQWDRVGPSSQGMLGPLPRQLLSGTPPLLSMTPQQLGSIPSCNSGILFGSLEPVMTSRAWGRVRVLPLHHCIFHPISLGLVSFLKTKITKNCLCILLCLSFSKWKTQKVLFFYLFPWVLCFAFLKTKTTERFCFVLCHLAATDVSKSFNDNQRLGRWRVTMIWLCVEHGSWYDYFALIMYAIW
jgi:hypothetical protein